MSEQEKVKILIDYIINKIHSCPLDDESGVDFEKECVEFGEVGDMTKKKCLNMHYPQSLSMAERLVLFHDTRFRIALSCHEFYCDKCRKARRIWFVNR